MNKSGKAKAAESANGTSEVTVPVEQEKFDTPKKSISNSNAPTSTKSRRGKKG